MMRSFYDGYGGWSLTPWLIVLLVINTMGILELIYLLAIVKVWPVKKVS